MFTNLSRVIHLSRDARAALATTVLVAIAFGLFAAIDFVTALAWLCSTILMTWTRG